MTSSWGVLAFVDVLGFKGISRRGHENASVLSALSSLKTYAEALVAAERRSYGGTMWDRLETDVRLFSDTLVISSSMPPPALDDSDPWYERMRRYMLLRYAVLNLTKLSTAAIRGDVPLLYRGCVACGEFLRNDFAMVGTAVDEGGTFFEAAEGAFIFLAPSAREVYRDARPFLFNATLPYFVEYDVPLKPSGNLPTFVVNPLLFRGDASTEALKARILGTFGRSGNLPTPVQAKHDNTKKFLEFLELQTPTWGDG
jgi:hypothetical protein